MVFYLLIYLYLSSSVKKICEPSECFLQAPVDDADCMEVDDGKQM